MTDENSWPDADQKRDVEMDAAQAAFTRLNAALDQLKSDTDPASPSLPRGAARRQNALNALQRHAAAVIAKFAFVEGTAVTSPDDALLAAFYPDPSDTVLARYCWALLDSGPEFSISSILGATHKENEAFLARHQAPQKGNTDDLTTAETGHGAQADRLAYCYSMLWRLSVIDHHLASAQSIAVDVAKAAEASEAAADTLRAIRRARLAAKTRR